jgi:hypothetical protein
MYLLIMSAILLSTLRYFLSADDDKIFCTITSLTDCILLQSYSDSIHSLCAVDSMKLNTDKTRVITFRRKTNYVIQC